MSAVVETIAFVFGLVALGYVAAWTGILRTQVGDALTEFAVVVAVPALLFRTMTTIDLQGTDPTSLWFSYFCSVPVAWIAGHFVATRVFGRDAAAGVVAGIASSFSNLLLLGIPFVLGVFGQPGMDVLSLLLAIHLPTMMAASIVMFELARRGEGEPSHPLKVLRDFLRNLFSNPLIIGILAGLAWRLTGLDMPVVGMRFIDAFAGIAGTVALFAMGLGLRKFGISGNVKPAIALGAIKLVVMPTIALGVAILWGLPPLTAKIMVIAASLPTGVNPYLIATRFGTGQVLASNTMTISTAFSVITLGFWLMVVQLVFG
ncbi:AEC family transporter [Mesorhizobium sp. CAU 1732]|uniref:AEC family transporter n=1 Tax=Mesorhizobium sp. CAU 1732 TaxID=3140358 RepID=UPI003260E295